MVGTHWNSVYVPVASETGFALDYDIKSSLTSQLFLRSSLLVAMQVSINCTLNKMSKYCSAKILVPVLSKSSGGLQQLVGDHL